MAALLNFFIIVAMFFVVPPAWAKIVNVADYGDTTMSVANFESAYAAASVGDTILFDGSDATWTGGTTIGKSVIIDLNGSTLTANGSAMSSGFFEITGFEATSLVRITGGIFQMTDRTPAVAIYVHTMTGINIRIDHNDFHQGSMAIAFYTPYGLIDNNNFYNVLLTVECSAGSNANAHASWSDMSAGTANAVFIEGNLFQINSSYVGAVLQEQIGAFNGGKVVARYNEFDSDDSPFGSDDTWQPIETHGNALGGAHGGDATWGYWERDTTETGPRRGPSVVEFYENTLHGDRIDFLAKLRGGANIVFNNDIIGTVANSPTIVFYEEEYSASSNFDPLRTVFPAEDQVHNSFVWGNTYNGESHFDDAGEFVLIPDATAGIVLNRDFFMHEPATTGSGETLGIETFTGSNGAAGSDPTDGDPYTDLGTMEFTADVENAYYGYVPYGTLVNDRYYHPLRDDIPTGASQLGITDSGISHGNGG